MRLTCASRFIRASASRSSPTRRAATSRPAWSRRWPSARRVRSVCSSNRSLPRPMPEAPRAVLDALEQADAGILCVQPQEGELAARMAIVAVVERRRIRYAHMVGVTPRIMREGMRADYRQVDRLSQQLCDRMQTARTLTVRTKGGTRFSARFDHTLAWVKTSGIINPAVLVEPSCRRSVHDAGERGRHVRVRRHGRRLLQREIRHPRPDAARPRDP